MERCVAETERITRLFRCYCISTRNYKVRLSLIKKSFIKTFEIEIEYKSFISRKFWVDESCRFQRYLLSFLFIDLSENGFLRHGLAPFCFFGNFWLFKKCYLFVFKLVQRIWKLAFVILILLEILCSTKIPLNVFWLKLSFLKFLQELEEFPFEPHFLKFYTLRKFFY